MTVTPLPPPVAPTLRHLFDLQVDVAPAIEVGDIGAGKRRIIPILGGTFAGPAARGEVLPGGADWQILRADGTIELVARYAIRTHDGATINVVNRGIRAGSPEVIARLTAGEAVDPSEYYFRTSPVFETGDPRYAALARTICVATAQRKPGGVIIRAFAVE